MSLFTSSRERRLWLISVLVIVAIYSTLGMAGVLSGFLRERGLLELSYMIGFLLVIVAIIGNALKRKQAKYEIWLQVGLFTVIGMIFLRMNMSPEERTHLFEYGFLALMIHEALVERKKNGKNKFHPAFLAIIITMILGCLDEFIQYLLPNRVFDLRDIGFNTFAGIMSVSANKFFVWLRKKMPG